MEEPPIPEGAVRQTWRMEGVRIFIFWIRRCRWKQSRRKGNKGEDFFEEMDSVWLRMQDSYHKRAPKQEMKIFTMHEGWDANSIKEGLWKSILLKKE